MINRWKRFYSDVAIPARQYGDETPLFLLPDVTGDISYAFGLAHNIVKNILVYVLPCRIFSFRLSLMYSDLLVSNYFITQANS